MVAFSERNESTEEFQDSRIPKCFIHSSLIMEDTGLVKVNLESVSLEIRKERDMEALLTLDKCQPLSNVRGKDRRTRSAFIQVVSACAPYRLTR